MVKPRPGFVMIDADFSQIEYRVLTALAGNDWLAELFSDPDSDYHQLMASLMYDVDYAAVSGDMRSAAKSFNFGIPYGMGFASLAILLTGNSSPASIEEAKEKYEMYFKNQPKTRKFFNMVKEQAQVNKYTETYWHRRRYYSFEDKDGNVNQARKAAALRQAGNAVIQGTAADVFKISVARNFSFIRNNGLMGKMLIINMIHDEQLMELDTRSLNIQKVLACIGQNMQFKINGFPPLFIGAGVGESWDEAKGSIAEIHPNLMAQYTEETKDMSIWVKDPIKLTDENFSFKYDFTTNNADIEYRKSPDEWLKIMRDKNQAFRVNKVKQYLLNPESKGQIIAPAIGKLINLRFTYGYKAGALQGDIVAMAKGEEVVNAHPELRKFVQNLLTHGYTVETIEKNASALASDLILKIGIAEFIVANGIEGQANPDDYLTQTESNLKTGKIVAGSVGDDEEDDAEYSDDDEDSFTDIDEELEYGNTHFALIDESDKAYGCNVVDLISVFGNFVSKSRKICGIDTRTISVKKLDALINYLYQHQCKEDDPGAMEIIFLKDCGILARTGEYVNGIDGSEVERRLKLAEVQYDFDERVQ